MIVLQEAVNLLVIFFIDLKISEILFHLHSILKGRETGGDTDLETSCQQRQQSSY